MKTKNHSKLSEIALSWEFFRKKQKQRIQKLRHCWALIYALIPPGYYLYKLERDKIFTIQPSNLVSIFWSKKFGMEMLRSRRDEHFKICEQYKTKPYVIYELKHYLIQVPKSRTVRKRQKLQSGGLIDSGLAQELGKAFAPKSFAKGGESGAFYDSGSK